MNKLSTLAFIAALAVAVPALAQTPADERNESAPAVATDHHETHMEAQKEHHKKMAQHHRHHEHKAHHKAQQPAPAGQ